MAVSLVKYPHIGSSIGGVLRDSMHYDVSKQWVAVEKIHGSNMGIVYSVATDRVSYQSRRVCLPGNTDFRGASGSADVQHATNCMRQLQALVGAKTRIVVFGELYGKRLQRELTYDAAAIHFAVFDILVDDNFLPFGDVVQHCAALNMRIAIVIATGTCADVFDQIDVEALVSCHSTTGEIAEGYILRHLAETGDLEKPRNILKVKRRLFSEKGVPSIPREATGSTRVVKLLVTTYFTPGRIASVMSKFDEGESVDVLAQELLDDALEDLRETPEHAPIWDELEDDALAHARRICLRAAAGLIRKYASQK